MKINKKSFNKPGCQEIIQYTISASLIELTLLNIGATIQYFKVLNKKTKSFQNIVLSYDDLEKYLSNPCYFGCVVGRVAGRIANGQFELNDKKYQLNINNPPNHLHGGANNLSKQIWKGEIIESGVVFRIKSCHMDEGYPGNVEISVIYEIVKDNQVKITYQAKTDEPTIINLTNHSYFNLNYDHNTTILNHQLYLNSKEYLQLNENFVPTGEIININDDKSMDFKEKGKLIGEDFEEISKTNTLGYDHYFILTDLEQKKQKLAAILTQYDNNIELQIETSYPGFQMYTANFLDGSEAHNKFKKQGAICFETQFFPNAINLEKFKKQVILQPGEDYSEFALLTLNNIE